MQPISGPSVVAFLEYMRINHPRITSLRDLSFDQLRNCIADFERLHKQTRRFNCELQLDAASMLRFIESPRNCSYADNWSWYWHNDQYDPLERYLQVPNRGIFLFTSEDKELRDYIKEHYEAFHERTGDRLDIYDYTITNNNFYSFSRDYMSALAPVPGVQSDIRLPCLILWSKYGDVVVPMGDLDTAQKIRTRMENIYEIIGNRPIEQLAIDQLMCIEHFDHFRNRQIIEPEPNPCDIFISYSHSEKSQVQSLVEQLSLRGPNIWHDQSIQYGERFVPRIFSQINACKLFVVCWSETAIRSSWVKSEVRHALSNGKRLWPLYFQAHEQDTGLAIPEPFGQFHTAILPMNHDQSLVTMSERIVDALALNGF